MSGTNEWDSQLQHSPLWILLLSMMFLVLHDLVLSARVGGTGLSVPLMMSAERGLRLWKLSPYRTESFDGIVKNKLPGKLFFFRSMRSSSVTYVRALYTGASHYIANRSDSSWFFVGF